MHQKIIKLIILLFIFTIYCEALSPRLGYITGNGTVAVCELSSDSYKFTNCMDALNSETNPFESTYGITYYNNYLYVVDMKAGKIFSCNIQTETTTSLECNKLETNSFNQPLNIDIFNNMAYITAESRVWQCPVYSNGTLGGCTSTNAIINGSYGVYRLNDQVYVTTNTEIANFQAYMNNTLSEDPMYSSLIDFHGTRGLSSVMNNLIAADKDRIVQCKVNPENGKVDICRDGIQFGQELTGYGICSIFFNNNYYVHVATGDLNFPVVYCTTDSQGILTNCLPYSCGIPLYSYDLTIYFS